MCGRLINRRLFKIILQDKPFTESVLSEIREKVKKLAGINDSEIGYYFYQGMLVNNAYNSESDKINILFKNGTVCDIAEAADTLNIKNLSKPVEKYYLCFPDINN